MIHCELLQSWQQKCYKKVMAHSNAHSNHFRECRWCSVLSASSCVSSTLLTQLPALSTLTIISHYDSLLPVSHRGLSCFKTGNRNAVESNDPKKCPPKSHARVPATPQTHPTYNQAPPSNVQQRQPNPSTANNMQQRQAMPTTAYQSPARLNIVNNAYL